MHSTQTTSSLLTESIICVFATSATPETQYTPLVLAAGRKDATDADLISMLLSAGADTNLKCMYHNTALHEAVERGHTQVSSAAKIARFLSRKRV